VQTGLNKTRVGEYLGRSGRTPEEKQFHAKLLDAYDDMLLCGAWCTGAVHVPQLDGPDDGACVISEWYACRYLRLFDFRRVAFDAALRAFLSEFRMPGEGQVVDRFMNRFSAVFCEQHPGIFADPDAAYVLAYSMMMLNTTLHNPNVAVRGLKRLHRSHTSAGVVFVCDTFVFVAASPNRRINERAWMSTLSLR